MTNDRCRGILQDLGYDLNPMKGTPGEFYTTERERDIKALCREILGGRNTPMINNFPTINGYPYLVQRLKARKDPATDKTGITRFFEFDYMGAAEFEFGAIPRAKKALQEILSKEKVNPVEITQDGHTVWYVGPKADLEMARTWFREELKVDYSPRMKESSRILQSYTKPKSYSTYDGWWCVDEGHRSSAVWGMFRTLELARNFLTGVRS